MAPRAGRRSRALASLLLASASAGASVAANAAVSLGARFAVGVALPAAACGGAAGSGSTSTSPPASSPPASNDRREALLARVLTSPDDVAAWLELSAEEDRAGRPSAALDALEQAKRQRAPLGKDLDDADRQREARLLLARGWARLERGAASALVDLRQAKAGGASVDDSDLVAAEVAAALAEVRHSDAKRRAEGLVALRKLADRGPEALEAQVARGGRAGASDSDRIAWTLWLWRHGAKRAAYDSMHALIHQSGLAQPPSFLDEATRSQWAIMSSWWRPSWRDAAPFPVMAATVRRRCAVVPFAGPLSFQCRPSQVVTAGARSSATELDVLRLPLAHRPPLHLPAAEMNALVTMVVRGFLEGAIEDAPRALLRLIDLKQTASSQDAAQQTLPARALVLRLVGDATSSAVLQKADQLTPADASERLLLAYEHLVRGDAAGAQPVLAQLEEIDETAPAVRRLRAVANALSSASAANASASAANIVATADAAAVRAAFADLAPVADPSMRNVETAHSEDPTARLLDIATRYRSDVSVARRKAADFVATSVDAAAAWAQLGALYLLLDDPASSRLAWQAAVERSPEPRFLQGLAVACAAAKDPDAALVFMTNAAAASGDPTPVLLDVAEELLRAGAAVHALQAAKSAMDLAPLELYAASLDVAVRAARALDRRDELAALRQLGAATEPPAAVDDASSPSSMDRALAADGPQLTELLWRATRWHPRSVPLRARLLARLPAADARRGVLVDELAALASDPDRSRRAAAVAALRAMSRRSL